MAAEMTEKHRDAFKAAPPSDRLPPDANGVVGISHTPPYAVNRGRLAVAFALLRAIGSERLLRSMRLSHLLSLVAVALLACDALPTTVPRAGSSEVVVDSSNNGGSVKAHVGDTIRVTLDSTAWTFQPVSPDAILAPAGQLVVSPAPRGTCYPGMDCGTTTARFKAVANGTAEITATRINCGEARRCVGAEGTFQVEIIAS
jgi:hypothetical protein